MDEPRTPPPASEAPAVPPRLGARDYGLIALLALATLGLRAYQLGTTEVTARDSIHYIHTAWRLEHGDWRQVIPDSPQHPGYPIAVLAASLPARLLFPHDLAYAMQLGAQFASAAASVLLTAPLFWLGAQLFPRRVAFAAVLLFQCLPCSGRILADGLSEPVFLLFAVTALALAMDALRSGSVVGFGLAGAASGLAYWTRPEGLLVPAAAAATLIGMQALARWRRPWPRVLIQGAVLAGAVLIVGGPYMVLIGGLTQKTTANKIMENESAGAAPGDGVADGPPLAVWWRGDGHDAVGRGLWAARMTAEVFAQAFFFVLWVPALAGLWWFRDRFRTVPGAAMLLLLCLALGGLLFRVAALMGYLSDRHMVLILVCGLPWAAAALDAAALGAATRLTRWRPGLAGRWWSAGSVWSACLLLAVTAIPLARTLEPLHADRTGFREAGRWLAEQAPANEGVFDPFGWAGYYAGRYFRPGDATRTACRYVVLEEGGNDHTHLVTIPEAKDAVRLRGGEVVRIFPVPRGKQPAAVVIYKLATTWETRPLP